MSARDIIAELPRLTATELRAIGQRIGELASRRSDAGALRAERVAGRLVLAGARVVRQTEVEAILDEFP